MKSFQSVLSDYSITERDHQWAGPEVQVLARDGDGACVKVHGHFGDIEMLPGGLGLAAHAVSGAARSKAPTSSVVLLRKSLIAMVGYLRSSESDAQHGCRLQTLVVIALHSICAR